MKRPIIIAVFLLSAVIIQAQDLQAVIEQQAEEMISSMKTGDIEPLLDHTLPELLEMGGGRETMKTLITQMLASTKEQGFTIDTIYVGKAGDIYEAGDDLHALIAQYLILGFEGGYIESESTLLAISKDKGKFWYFIDVKQLTDEIREALLPVMNENMVIPEPKEPQQVFYYKDE